MLNRGDKMFKIKYKITNLFDDIKGLEGFFQIICNDYAYGDFYPEELEEIMDKVTIYNWIEYLLDVALNLEKYNCTIKRYRII